MKALENFKQVNDQLRFATDELKESNPKLENALKVANVHAQAFTTCANQIKNIVNNLENNEKING